MWLNLVFYKLRQNELKIELKCTLTKIVTLLEKERTSQRTFDLDSSNDFLDMTLKARISKVY